MDVGDDDLFAVFDSESSKDKQLPTADEESNNGVELKEELGEDVTATKRSAAEVEGAEKDVKKMKIDSEMTIMTGLRKEDVEQKLAADAQHERVADDEDGVPDDDQTVISLVEAAPR